MEILIKNENFGEKWKLWWKMETLVKNVNSAEIEILVKNGKFWPKMEILVKSGNFGQKWKFLSKIEITLKNIRRTYFEEGKNL